MHKLSLLSLIFLLWNVFLDKKADNDKFSDEFTKNESDTEEEFFECEGKDLTQYYFTSVCASGL